MPRNVSLSDSKCWNGGHAWVTDMQRFRISSALTRSPERSQHACTAASSTFWDSYWKLACHVTRLSAGGMHKTCVKITKSEEILVRIIFDTFRILVPFGIFFRIIFGTFRILVPFGIFFRIIFGTFNKCTFFQPGFRIIVLTFSEAPLPQLGPPLGEGEATPPLWLQGHQGYGVGGGVGFQHRAFQHPTGGNGTFFYYSGKYFIYYY